MSDIPVEDFDQYTVIHNKDVEGNPTGGYVFGFGYNIIWQTDPLTKAQIKSAGASVEAVLNACKGRLTELNSGKLASPEVSTALGLVDQAIAVLLARKI